MFQPTMYNGKLTSNLLKLIYYLLLSFIEFELLIIEFHSIILINKRCLTKYT